MYRDVCIMCITTDDFERYTRYCGYVFVLRSLATTSHQPLRQRHSGRTGQDLSHVAICVSNPQHTFARIIKSVGVSVYLSFTHSLTRSIFVALSEECLWRIHAWFALCAAFITHLDKKQKPTRDVFGFGFKLISNRSWNTIHRHDQTTHTFVLERIGATLDELARNGLSQWRNWKNIS